jgi:hypothetical protein
MFWWRMAWFHYLIYLATALYYRSEVLHICHCLTLEMLSDFFEPNRLRVVQDVILGYEHTRTLSSASLTPPEVHVERMQPIMQEGCNASEWIDNNTTRLKKRAGSNAVSTSASTGTWANVVKRKEGLGRRFQGTILSKNLVDLTLCIIDFTT